MSNRILLLFIYSFLALSRGLAQTNSAVKQINVIKQDTSYLYAEATMKTWDEAYNGAKAILEASVQDWASKRHLLRKDATLLAKSNKKILEIKTSRGDYVRAFLYIRKSDIIPVSEQQEVMLINGGKGIKYKQLDEKEAREKDVDKIKKGVVGSVVENLHAPAYSLNEEERRFAGIKSFASIESVVQALQNEGELKDFGKYKTLPSDGTAYLFVYDRQGEVKAVLKRMSDKTINLQTLDDDNIESYKNCGAIWIRLN